MRAGMPLGFFQHFSEPALTVFGKEVMKAAHRAGRKLNQNLPRGFADNTKLTL
jgi:hypothetical protein